MSLAVVYSRANVGIHAPLITVEVHLANGLPAFHMVGLPETSVKEAKDRVRAALINAGFEFPAKRITVNLAPADLPKDGGRFDVAIALGIIAASGMVEPSVLQNIEVVGELALSGAIRSVSGVVPFTYACSKAGRQAFVPAQDKQEAMLVEGAKVYAVEHLGQLLPHFEQRQPVVPVVRKATTDSFAYTHDLQDIAGQAMAKRALEIAAAGAHNILFCGPPGTGKTMLASRLLTLLPPLTDDEALEVATIHSIHGEPVTPENWHQRRFRQPHHTSSAAALVGGGSIPRPGEASLAHHGVLFLDELPEFKRHVLDVLREPLEEGQVCISRAASQATFPAAFQLVAAMNPSPTGSLRDGRSSSEQILRYINRLSGPFIDRIDLQVDVPRLTPAEIHAAEERPCESSETVRTRVITARNLQLQRSGTVNYKLKGKALQQACGLSSQDKDYLHNVIERLGLSMRAYHRILRVARTIADLQQAPHVSRIHLQEALSYRALDNIITSLQAV